MADTISISPILKWVGGKRQLLSNIIPLISKDFSTYVEPFVGGGAVFFALQPKKAIINDYNVELINVYKVVRDFPEELISILEEHSKKNLAGQFNSPYGRYKNPNIINAVTIRAMSKYLQNPNIIIKQGDYKEVLKGLHKGAFVYFDPPYMPISSSSSFTGYTQNGFSYSQQTILKNVCDQLKEKGIPFLQSNSDCPQIRELYKGYDIRTVQAKRTINSNANKRGEISEVLISYVPKSK